MSNTKERLLARELRYLGMSQKDCAKKINVTEKTISDICNGVTKKVTAQMWRKLSEIGVPRKALINPSKEV